MSVHPSSYVQHPLLDVLSGKLASKTFNGIRLAAHLLFSVNAKREPNPKDVGFRLPQRGKNPLVTGRPSVKAGRNRDKQGAPEWPNMLKKICYH